MRERRKLVFILLLVVLLPFLKFDSTVDKEVYISKVLETEAYSYLPVEAKEYIKEVYIETGQVLNTEKNKEENIPYLNPRYVEYLSSNKKDDYEVIPNEIILDYIYVGSNEIEELPSSYDLRNVDGKNFVTPLKNQGNLGICWAFATVAQAESYLLVSSDTSYEEGMSQLFSERQFDYLTAVGSLNGAESPYSVNRTLGNGGNFRYAIIPSINGVGFQLSNVFGEYNDKDYSRKSYYDVLNYNKSVYEVNSTIDMPHLNISELDLSQEENLLEKEEYLNTIKQKIMEYGGAVVSTESPQGSCASKIGNSYLIRTDTNCIQDSGHAMQIIGWDDDYTYEYCASENMHSSDISSCPLESIVRGSGAWLIKNSWGISDYSYVYLAYDSLNLEINFITNMTLTEDRTWDNSYFDNTYINDGYMYISTGDSIELTKSFSTNEKIEKIKFTAYVQGGTYNIYKVVSNKAELIKTVNVDLPGIYTIDLSDKNILLDENTQLNVSINGNQMILPVTIFTSNISDLKEANTVENSSLGLITSSDKNYKFYLATKTRNIPSNEEIDYELYDSVGNNLSEYISYENNIIGDNVAYPILKISTSVPNEDTYVLKTIYNSEVLSEINISLPEQSIELEGEGTIENPYLIMAEEEFLYINEQPDAYYKLMNDIWLDFDSSIDKFTGVLDGNNKTIYGDYGVVFENIESSLNHDTEIKDLRIEGLNFAYTINDCSNSECTNNKVLVKNITLVNNDYSIYQITSSHEEGIIIENIYFSDSKFIKNLNSTQTGLVKIKNIQTVSEELNTWLEDTDDKESVALLIETIDGNVDIENIIFTTSTLESRYRYVILGDILNENSIINIKNGYYSENMEVIDSSNISNISVENVSKESVFDLTDIDMYTDWDSFNESWDLKTIDGVPRIPILKNESDYFNYIEKPETKYMLPGDMSRQNILLENDYLFFEILDSDLIELNFHTLYALNSGNARIHVFSYHDGYDDIMNINIDENNYKYRLKIHSNYDEDEIYYQPVSDYTYYIYDDIVDKTGYYIESLNTKSDGTGTKYLNGNISNLDNEVVDGFIELYAQWAPIYYYINYDANGGTGYMSSKLAYYDSQITLSKNSYSRKSFDTGYYEFKNWNTLSDGTGITYEDKATVKNLSTEMYNRVYLYAQWDLKGFYIRYKLPGEDNTDDTLCSYSGCICYKSVTTPIGYSVGSWNTKEDGTGDNYYLGDDLTHLSSTGEGIYLYAQMKPNTYKVSFNPNGGTIQEQEKDVTYDSEYGELPIPQKSGYRFIEWNTNEDGTGNTITSNSIVEITNAITLYAKWEPIEYTLNYNSNGGEGSMQGVNLAYNQEYSLDYNIFIRLGYTFDSWNTKEDGTGIKYTDNQSITNLTNTDQDEVILYAQWVPNKYTITFMDGENEIISITQDYNTDVIAPNIPEKIGYTFTEWDKEVPSKIPAENITINAQWNPITYSIKFNANDGEGNMDDMILSYDQEYTLSFNRFTNDDLVFDSWNTKEDGTGTTYTNEQKVKNLTATHNDEIVLYAIWKEGTPYKINEYEYDEDDNYISSISINTELNTFTSNIILSYGYGIDVDSKEIDGKNVLYTGGKTRITKGLAVYKEYTNIVTGDTNGDGKITYLDYVRIYNHIQKAKHPELNKKLLENEYFIAADMNNNNKLDYLDYVRIYNKIKELKGGTN